MDRPFDDFDTEQQIDEIIHDEDWDIEAERRANDEDRELEDRLYPWLADDSMADHNS
jgi:hypothetical protein